MYVLYHIVRCLMSAAADSAVVVGPHPRRMYVIAAFNVFSWCIYPVGLYKLNPVDP
jgi:hypothetical protein